MNHCFTCKSGLKKINFAGGEPFLQMKFLGQLLKYCKEELHIETTSVVTNGSIIHNKPRWFKQYAKYLDVFAISCDSFRDNVNRNIGRFNKSKSNQTEVVESCAKMCAEYNIPFKINTVVNAYNWDEKMVSHIQVECGSLIQIASEEYNDVTVWLKLIRFD